MPVSRAGTSAAWLAACLFGSALMPGASEARADAAAPARSPRPSKADFRSAPRVTPARQQGRQAAHCTVVQVREWIRVFCEGFRVAAVSHLAGPSASEDFSLMPADARGLPTSGGASFPLVQGEARALLFWTLGDGYDGPLTVIPAVVVQTDYLGEQPVILLHDALHEPVRTAASEKRRHEQE